MSQRVLVLILVLLVGLILMSRMRQAGDVPPPPPPPATEVTVEAPVTTTRAPMLAPHPNALAEPPTSTPTIDLMAILAVRRRIEREGTNVYLDSMLAQTDSSVARWVDRNNNPLRVRFVPDSNGINVTTALLDAARGGMSAWNGNSAGVRFVEVQDTADVDITVSFLAVVPDSGQFGVTNFSWAPNGSAERAEIQLALRPDSAAPMLTPAMMRRVAIHEFGHAIGLPHSGSRNDIMFPSSPVSAPSGRDLATLQLLYALPPGSVKTP